MQATISSRYGDFAFSLLPDGTVKAVISKFNALETRTKYHGNDEKEFVWICRNIFKAYTEQLRAKAR